MYLLPIQDYGVGQTFALKTYPIEIKIQMSKKKYNHYSKAKWNKVFQQISGRIKFGRSLVNTENGDTAA